MDLDAWLIRALDAQDRGVPLPAQTTDQAFVPTTTRPQKRKSGTGPDGKPMPTRGRGVRAARRKTANPGRRGRRRAKCEGITDCPYEDNPLKNFKQIPIRWCSPSLSPVQDSYMLSDDESVDEGVTNGLSGAENDSRHYLDVLYEDGVEVRKAFDAELEDMALEKRRLAKKKKDKKGKMAKKLKDVQAEGTVEFTGISTGAERRRREYDLSMSLCRKREVMPMATVLRRSGMKSEYYYLGSKLDPKDGLSGLSQTKMPWMKAQQGSAASRVKENKARMKQLVDQMNASAAPPRQHHHQKQQEAAEEQSALPGGTRERSSSPPVKRMWPGRDPEAKSLRRSSSSFSSSSSSSSSSFSSSSSSSHSDVSSFSRIASHSTHRDAFFDDDAASEPSSSCSKDECRRSAPIWDASKRYPEILDPENWLKEEEPLYSDSEDTFEQFKQDYEKYKAKDRVGVSFWEELRRDIPSFGFDRAREEKFYVGYDENGQEVRYRDEKFMEKRIRDSQVLEYQAECRLLLDEQEEQAKQQEEVQEQADAERKDVSYVGKKLSVQWKHGYEGIPVYMKKVWLKDGEPECELGIRTERGVKWRDQEDLAPHQGQDDKAKVTNTKNQSDVHKEVIKLVKKVRLTDAKKRKEEDTWRRQFGDYKGVSAWTEGLILGGGELDQEFGNNLASDGLEDDFLNNFGDDNFEEDLKQWNDGELDDAAASDTEKRNLQKEEHFEFDGKFLSDDETDEEEDDDKDSLMAVLKTVPKFETVKKTERVCKKKDERYWARYLKKKKEKNRKERQEEAERCRQVIFSKSVEFQKQEKERKRNENKRRMLDDLKHLNNGLHELLEDITDEEQE